MWYLFWCNHQRLLFFALNFDRESSLPNVTGTKYHYERSLSLNSKSAVLQTLFFRYLQFNSKNRNVGEKNRYFSRCCRFATTMMISGRSVIGLRSTEQLAVRWGTLLWPAWVNVKTPLLRFVVDNRSTYCGLVAGFRFLVSKSISITVALAPLHHFLVIA